MFAPAEIAPQDTAAAPPVEKSLLRFTTAGSVDDGKSTLIGRLLYDSQSVYEDQLRSITQASVNRSAGPIDFSLLTDGLRAEREQGITIDVAYRYFATAKRKFIIADTPGHEQYTRNMATGASTADLAVILIDARHGVLPQSRRHAVIASLLGTPRIVAAVNKMDLVGFDEAVFNRIRDEFHSFLTRLNLFDAYTVPISALGGDNVVHRSNHMPWFHGPSLLEHLEAIDTGRDQSDGPFRFPVQRVVRPDQSFRGYAGQIAGGSIAPGDPILVLPSGRRTKVKSIDTFDGQLSRAFAPMSVTLTLEEEIDISRGDLISNAKDTPLVARHFEADIVWMQDQPLTAGSRYFLKHTTQTVAAEVQAVTHRIDIHSLAEDAAESLGMNSIGRVQIETARPIFFDPYSSNRFTGSFILIDSVTNGTAGAGMLRRSLDRQQTRVQTVDHRAEPVTPAERIARFGHRAATVLAGPRRDLAFTLERKLFTRGCAVTVLEDAPAEVTAALEAAGILVIVIGLEPVALPLDDVQAADQLIAQLVRDGVLFASDTEIDGGAGI
jgi:sulfate adenylyltransferase large subunit